MGSNVFKKKSLKCVKQVIAVVLLFVIAFTCDTTNAVAEAAGTEVQQEVSEHSVGSMGGYLVANIISSELTFDDHKFIWGYKPSRHGFAAERMNNLFDRLQGWNAIIVGDNNVKNGPDRLITLKNGQKIFIQDKYYKVASESVNAAFDDTSGMYKYLDADGVPMQLEVPKDQYDDAVKLMESKISEGKVSGITDISEAKNLVREGRLTYKQAVNLTKAGTMESLTYDSAKGIVTAAGACGITFVIDFAFEVINGIDTEVALQNAIKNGIKAGGVAFATSVITRQLLRTSLGEVFKPTTQAIATALGPKVCKAIIESTGASAAAAVASKTLTRQAAQIISSNIIADVVLLAVLTAIDAVELFRGRISLSQFLQNLAVALIGVGAGAAGAGIGAVVGTAIAPGVGTAIGATVGGLISGVAGAYGGNVLMSENFETDGEKMYEIISNEFSTLAEDYLINEEEAGAIAEILKTKLSGDTLKDMYASEDREAFAKGILEPLFEEQASKRERIGKVNPITERYAYRDLMDGIIFVH